jgi:integrase/recombinase XerD
VKHAYETTDFAYMLTRYLSNYLPGQCNSSSNTILAYRDVFKLLIRFTETKCGIVPENLTLAKIDKQFVENFLTWLEISQGSSIATRNHRLAAIHAFFRYLQREKPEIMAQCQQVLDIRIKKTGKPTVSYLTVDSLKLLLAVPDTTDKYGFRDAVILGLLYDTGARVSELTELRPMDLRLKSPAIVSVIGKGRKARELPISPTLADNLSEFIERWKLNTPDKAGLPLFTNHKNEKLGRAGVAYVLNKYADVVREQNPELLRANVSPHTLRHSKAMHMLEAGVNLIYIRDQLGHAHIKTTEIYARANPEMKRSALEKVAGSTALLEKLPPWTADSNLMNYLNSLGR